MVKKIIEALSLWELVMLGIAFFLLAPHIGDAIYTVRTWFA